MCVFFRDRVGHIEIKMVLNYTAETAPGFDRKNVARTLHKHINTDDILRHICCVNW